MNKLKLKHLVIFILSVITLVLCVTLIITSISFANYKITMTTPATTTSEPETELPEEEVISVDAFKQTAAEYNLSIEVIQQFFDDVIVYRDSSGLVYDPIDQTLPQHTYDFDNLVPVDNEIQYQVNGVSTGIKGIDISKYQGEVDWEKVKADGVEFVILRLGYRGYETGKVILDETFEANVKGATEAGIEVGVYFFSQAITQAEAIEEATMVLDYIKDYDITYPVVYDAEEIYDANARTNVLTTEQRTDFTITFCEQIKAAGYTPMIYGNIKWMVAQLDLTQLTQYDKWFAQYFKEPFFPYDFQMWQYTATGKVDGIEGDVDINISFKDYANAPQ